MSRHPSIPVGGAAIAAGLVQILSACAQRQEVAAPGPLAGGSTAGQATAIARDATSRPANDAALSASSQPGDTAAKAATAPTAPPVTTASTTTDEARGGAYAEPEEALGGTYGSAEMPEAMPVPPSAPPPGNFRVSPVAPFPRSVAVNTERYLATSENPVHLVASDPVSTFSLDVDTGSYSNVRRFLNAGSRPPEDAVRIEELVNYFPYDYPKASGEHPFGVRTELAPCPWKPGHWLMRVAVRADEVDAKEMPPANLVFLVDVSGSMDAPAKLPLLRSSLKLLVGQLRAEDRVSMVVYAGREAVVLEPTPGDQHARIEAAIDNLSAGGSTAGEAGIRAAYRMARAAWIRGGINRVLLATDGDFNVGITDFEQVKDLVERERESGIQLSTLGFGTGNYNEALMEQVADVGNGTYAYIDSLQEGRKVLVDQMRSTLVTVAGDVKVQVEFNPAAIAEYRLLGYENRLLAREDFQNDRVDAGDVGAGQSVTALYELTPVGAAPSVDPLRYGSGATPPAPAGEAPAEVAFVKLRYKRPGATESRLVEFPVLRHSLLASFDAAGDDFRFATAVAGFGQLLRGGRHAGTWTFEDVLGVATSSRGRDEYGYRSEFLSLVRQARIAG